MKSPLSLETWLWLRGENRNTPLTGEGIVAGAGGDKERLVALIDTAIIDVYRKGHKDGKRDPF